MPIFIVLGAGVVGFAAGLAINDTFDKALKVAAGGTAVYFGYQYAVKKGFI